MGRSCFLTVVAVSFFLALFFSHGFGRKLTLTTADQHQASSSLAELEEIPVKSRSMMASLMDYADPQPNVNPRTGYIFSPPPPRRN